MAENSHPKRIVLRFLITAASVVTLLFGLSTIFSFGIATHRRASLSWHSAARNADLVQVACYRGQFRLNIIFFNDPRFPPPTEPRRWHAGAEYLPDLELNVRLEHVLSRYGAGIELFSGPRCHMGYIGIFGLYPTLLLWGLVWVIGRRKQHVPGYCPMCGYDLRASMERCPECGTAIPAGQVVEVEEKKVCGYGCASNTDEEKRKEK